MKVNTAKKEEVLYKGEHLVKLEEIENQVSELKTQIESLSKSSPKKRSR